MKRKQALETPLENRKGGVWHENEEDSKNPEKVTRLYRGDKLPESDGGGSGKANP